MAQLNFPDPNVSTTYTEAGITWTWNATLEVWSSETDEEGGSSNVSVGDNPPGSPNSGDLWWNSSDDSGRLYVYYEDGNSSQWVEASPQGEGLSEDEADDLYLSKVDDDTAAGEITFEGTTTHENGVSVTGGDNTTIEKGICIFNDRLALINDNKAVFTIGKDQQAYGLYSNSDIQLNQSGTEPSLLRLEYKGTGHLSTAKYCGVSSAVSTDVGSSIAAFRTEQLNSPVQTADNIKVIGFSSNIQNSAVSGTNSETYNFYAEGNAPNYFAGNVKVASSDNDNITNPQSSCVLLSANNIDITRRSGNADQGCLGLRRSAAANGGFISFSSADGSATDFGGTDARIRLSGYGNVVTTGITNTFSISRTSAAPAGIVDSVAIVQALSPGTTGFAAQDLIDNAPVAVIENDPAEDEVLIDQTKLIPLLTKALQEVLAKNEELETRIAALEGA